MSRPSAWTGPVEGEWLQPAADFKASLLAWSPARDGPPESYYLSRKSSLRFPNDHGSAPVAAWHPHAPDPG